ncbi:MAG TPA: DnaD domain protein [Acholeplasma sp.]|jgi:DNA replication protein|nr:DnaD domain protein [Acholeplasma sp.]
MIGKLFDKGLINYHQLIFEYQSKLELTSDEVVVLMQLLNLAQRKRYSLSTLTLARMTSLKTNVVGEIVNSLFEKDIISIQFERKTSNEKLKEVFDLKPLFAKILDFLEEDIERDKEIKSITDIEYVIRVLEKTFDKPLTPRYLEIVKQWFTDEYTKEEIDQAIETTKEHGRKSVNYVDKILRSETFAQETNIDEKTADFLRKLVGK